MLFGRKAHTKGNPPRFAETTILIEAAITLLAFKESTNTSGPNQNRFRTLSLYRLRKTNNKWKLSFRTYWRN